MHEIVHSFGEVIASNNSVTDPFDLILENFAFIEVATSQPALQPSKKEMSHGLRSGEYGG